MNRREMPRITEVGELVGPGMHQGENLIKACGCVIEGGTLSHMCNKHAAIHTSGLDVKAKQWEYRWEQLPFDVSLVEWLNELGTQGWELVQIGFTQPVQSAIFKQQVLP